MRINVTHSLGTWWSRKQEGKVTPYLLCLLLLSFQKTGLAFLLPWDISELANGCILGIKCSLQSCFFFLYNTMWNTWTFSPFYFIIFGHYLSILINIRNRSCDSALAAARMKCSATEFQSDLKKCLFTYLHEDKTRYVFLCMIASFSLILNRSILHLIMYGMFYLPSTLACASQRKRVKSPCCPLTLKKANRIFWKWMPLCC